MDKYLLSMEWNEYPSDVLYLWNGNTIFRIAEGDGGNLLPEDEEEGYKDYWMTEWYDINGQEDGGQWMERELISDIGYTIQGVLWRLMDCDLWEDNWEILPPAIGSEILSCFMGIAELYNDKSLRLEEERTYE